MFSQDGLDRRTIKRLERANIPNQFQGWDWDDLSPYKNDILVEVRDWAQAVVDAQVIEQQGKIGGKGLLLYGEPGHGKTALASVALQAILRASQLPTWGPGYERTFQPSRGAYMTYYRNLQQMLYRQMDGQLSDADEQLLMDIRGAWTNETTIRLLVLDDVGKEHRTDNGWAAKNLEGLIRERFYSGWPTVVTTNMSFKEWQAAYGSSAASFVREAFLPLQVISPVGDRRRNEVA